jgi:hypothetical protein
MRNPKRLSQQYHVFSSMETSLAYISSLFMFLTCSTVQYPADEIRTLLFDVIFTF